MIPNWLKKNWFYIFLFFVLLPSIFGIIYCILKYYLINLNLPVTGERLGQFGDYIGGLLNPILTFFSFLALLITIIIQNKQLDVSTRELHSTNKTLIENQKVMSEQLLTQSLQQFDSTFFAMLRELNNLQLDLNSLVTQDYSKITSCLKDVMFEDSDDIQMYIKKVLNNREVSRYFMLLYQILRIIDTKIDDNIYIKTNKFLTKKMYSNIVRSSISEELMQLLIINALNKSFLPFKKLIEKFNLFEHTSFLNRRGNLSLLLINATQYYDNSAFDKSFYFEDLENKITLSKYIIKNNIITNRSLFEYLFKKLSINNILVGPINYGMVEGFFCEIKLNCNDIPIGFFISKNDLKPILFVSLDRGHFKTYENIGRLNTLMGINEILISNNEGETELKIIFNNNGEVTYVISDKIKEF
jgi:hypothetical protein